MAEATAPQGQGITRREFLNYVWGAAISLFMAEFGVGVLLFMVPRFRAGEFGGDFELGLLSEILPAPDTGPNEFPQSKTWLVNVGPNEAEKGRSKQGLLAIYKVCTHLGCLYKFEATTDRFECPCHGSKFHLDGTKIAEFGPAPRSLDRFIIELKNEAGDVVASTVSDGSPSYNDKNGTPLELPADISGLRVWVKTGNRIEGAPPLSDDKAKRPGG